MLLSPNKLEKRKIDPIVDQFLSDLDDPRLVPIFMDSVVRYVNESRELKKLVHSVRSRIKDPDHLYDKLLRKLREAKSNKKNFSITPKNLFKKINDLGGVRIIHVHTKQIADIDRHLRTIIQQQALKLIEGPIARTWDDESREYFQSIGMKTKKSATMYTSVHYILGSSASETVTCELQVRTLMEEVWGEVDHKINYPHPTGSVACREQIRALARATSAATRLVDSIFATADDLDTQTPAKSALQKPKRKKGEKKKARKATSRKRAKAAKR